MELEVPEFKRCCCCIPLRYGLIFWGYVKLIFSIVFLGLMVFITITMANMIQRVIGKDRPLQITVSYFTWEIIAIVFLTLVVLLEISMNIVFLVGGHKKIPKLMEVFYYYSIVMFCLNIFAFSVSTTIELLFEVPYVMRNNSFSSSVFYIGSKLCAGILNTAVQLYLILLTRSEIRKLQNNSKFSFKNNAAEAECNMEPEGGNIEGTEIKVNVDNVDAIRNNNINRDKDEKLKLNKYQLIKNIDVEHI